MDALKKRNVQVFAICCDNIDSIHAWVTSLGGLSFPALADFWPHGKVSKEYGVFNEDGVPDRVMIVVGPDGKICHIDARSAEDIPSIEEVVQICDRID